MPRRRQVVIATLAAAALGGRVGGSAAQHIPGNAARVNGAEISNFRLERHFEEYLKAQRRNVAAMINPRVYKKLKREALDQLIERELLWQAASAEGVVAADDEVQAVLAQMREQLGTREAYERKLAHAGFDEAAFAEYMRRSLSGAKLLGRRVPAAPEVGDDEIAAYYRANTHRFGEPPRPLDEVRDAIRARLVGDKRAAQAREIVAGLKAGARIELLLSLD
jgi:peptidyl-prolyl cis-trans isomerase C